MTVNTQHRECANLYIKKGSGVRATASDNDKFSETHSLWLEETEIGFYSLTLTARVDCDYTVQFTTAGHKLLSRLAAGIFKDVRLPSNGVSRFLYEHNSLDSIKLLAMKSSG